MSLRYNQKAQARMPDQGRQIFLCSAKKILAIAQAASVNPVHVAAQQIFPGLPGRFAKPGSLRPGQARKGLR